MNTNRNPQTQRIKHLYWRAGFGLSPQEWQERQHWRTTQAVNHLFQEAENVRTIASTNSRSSQATIHKTTRGEERSRLGINHDWVMRMGGHPQGSVLLEKMTLFWHGHFACKIKTRPLAQQQLDTIRTYALGNFRDLVLAIAKDPAMIRYLNNQQNRKRSPNENFARELLELFTIGRGHYTEKDVQEAARAFTGWSSKAGVFFFQEKFHDFGSKTFFGVQGNLNGEDIIDQLLAKPATAQFICRKIYRYFVNEQVDETRVNLLAETFYQSNYDIATLMRELFLSDWFYSANHRANKIKSPVILLAGIIRQLGLRGIPPKNLIALEKALGQVLFAPPNVAGWPGGKYWVNNSTLMLRLQLAGAIFQTSTLNYAIKTELDETQPWQFKHLNVNLNLQMLQALVPQHSSSVHFTELADFLLSPNVQNLRETILRFSDTTSTANSVKSICVNLMTLPEYQLH